MEVKEEWRKFVLFFKCFLFEKFYVYRKLMGKLMLYLYINISMAFGGQCSCAQMLWSSIYYIPPGAHFELHKSIGMSKMVALHLLYLYYRQYQ